VKGKDRLEDPVGSTACCLGLAGCSLGLLLDPEDGSCKSLRNIDELLPEYTASHHGRGKDCRRIDGKRETDGMTQTC
jgi:hypothetical protein